MCNFALLGPPLPSHLFHMGALGRDLQKRGHTVTLIGLQDVQREIEAEEIPFQVIGAESHPVGEVARFRSQLGQSKGIAGLRLAMAAVRRMNETIFNELPGILKNLKADVLIADQAEPAAGTVSEYLGLPWVTVCNGLPIHRELQIPPYFTPWNYRPDWLGAIRNQTGYAVFDRVTTSIRRGVFARRQAWGLPRYSHPDDVNSPFLQLCQIPPEFDFPRKHVPPQFHYTGPFRRTMHRPVKFPWDRLTRQRLVYASMGTLQNGLFFVFRAIAEACSRLDLQLVLSLGNGCSIAGMGPLPGSPVVVEFSPQMELLKRADLLITHGGLNSVQEALLEGVPVITIPVTSDQGGVAARLKWIGAGEMILLRQLSATRLESAMKLVLGKESFKKNALRAQEAILKTGGVSLAADLIEKTFDGRGTTAQLESIQLVKISGAVSTVLPTPRHG